MELLLKIWFFFRLKASLIEASTGNIVYTLKLDYTNELVCAKVQLSAPRNLARMKLHRDFVKRPVLKFDNFSKFLPA